MLWFSCMAATARGLTSRTIAKNLLAYIPLPIAKRYLAVPFELSGETLKVAMLEPDNREALELLKTATGKIIKPYQTTQRVLEKLFKQYSEFTELVKEVSQTEPEKREAKVDQQVIIEERALENAPAAKIITTLLRKAINDRASDIHIEPTEKELVVRFRIDGVLKKVVTLPIGLHPGVISRVKILSKLRIDETRLPQDGRYQAVIDEHDVDFRISTLPTVNGEKVVMRILDKTKGLLKIEDLGLRGRAFEILTEAITKTHGMILVTGPTGSGKTTTLYSVLHQLHQEGVNIVTLEDPVEYRIAGVNQSQVNSEIEYTFATGLRTILRQDPNIIMVGEIRDLESGELAIQAALTGHVVLSTLHTNSAAGAIPRLVDMGIQPFLIASSVNTLIAQRLARKLCDHCKKPTKLDSANQKQVNELVKNLPNHPQFFEARGCDQCSNSGFKGRLGIYEVLPMINKISQLDLAKASAEEIEQVATAAGMTTMQQDGIIKASLGLTTIEEVWRVSKE